MGIQRLGINGNKTTYQNLCDTVKAVLRLIFIAINGCIRKKKDLKSITTFYLKKIKNRNKLILRQAEERD